MSEFNTKNKRSFWHSPIVLLVIFCIIIGFSFNIFKLLEKERETSKKKEQILSQIEDLREREDLLKKDIAKLNTEIGVEETIRDKYQVVKEGEKMVVIVDRNEQVQNDLSLEKENHNFWSWIKKTFGL